MRNISLKVKVGQVTFTVELLVVKAKVYAFGKHLFSIIKRGNSWDTVEITVPQLRAFHNMHFPYNILFQRGVPRDLDAFINLFLMEFKSTLKKLRNQKKEKENSEILQIESQNSIDRKSRTEEGSGYSIDRKNRKKDLEVGSTEDYIKKVIESYKQSAYLIIESTARKNDPKTVFIDFVSVIRSRTIKWQNRKSVEVRDLGDGYKFIIIKTVYGFFDYELMFYVDDRGHYLASVIRTTTDFGKEILTKIAETIAKAKR